MKKEAILATAAGLSKFWDGSRVDRIRVIDGNSHLYGRRLSVHLMMQEQVGLDFLRHNILSDQGLTSRFLAGWPTSTVGSRRYSSVNVKTSAPLLAFYEKVSRAMNKELQYAEGSGGFELAPPLMAMSPEAKRAWEACYNEIEEASAPKQPLAPVRGFANKAAEHAARIAATIQLFEDPDSTEITSSSMSCAITLIEWFLDEALRITGAFTPDYFLQKSKEVLRWIHDNNFYHVALPDLYQYSPVRTASQARKVVEILKSHYHLYDPPSPKGKKEAVSTKNGKKSWEWWEVHPESREIFFGS